VALFVCRESREVSLCHYVEREAIKTGKDCQHKLIDYNQDRNYYQYGFIDFKTDIIPLKYEWLNTISPDVEDSWLRTTKFSAAELSKVEPLEFEIHWGASIIFWHNNTIYGTLPKGRKSYSSSAS